MPRQGLECGNQDDPQTLFLKDDATSKRSLRSQDGHYLKREMLLSGCLVHFASVSFADEKTRLTIMEKRH